MAGLGEVRIINLIAHQRPIVGPGGIPPRISGFLKSFLVQLGGKIADIYTTPG